MSHVSDVDHCRLDAIVYPDCVVEVHRISDIAQGLRKAAVTKIWRTERVLGRGSSGEVHLQLQDGDHQSKRAVKVIPMRERMSSEECARELTALIEFSKPKYRDEAVFVHFLGWFQTEEAIFLAMEYIPLGDLENKLQELERSRYIAGHPDGRTGSGLSEGDVKDIVTQILEGIKIMHGEGFTHRDLKPQNILVVQTEPKWWVKLGDFGLSKRGTETSVLYTQAGTLSYMAPEILQYVQGLNPDSSEYTNAVDIWALGCITYRIFTGKPPFPDLRSLKYYCSDPKLPISLGGLTENFMQQLLAPHPTERLTATSALEHLWLTTNKTPTSSTSPLSAALTESQYNYNTASHPGLRSFYPLTIEEKTLVRPSAVNRRPTTDWLMAEPGLPI